MASEQSLEISIKGTGAVIQPAERAIVSIKAESNHEATPQAASAAITAAATRIREMVNDHMLHDEHNNIHPESAIAHWSMSKLETNRRFTPASFSKDGQRSEDKTYGTSQYSAIELSTDESQDTTRLKQPSKSNSRTSVF